MKESRFLRNGLSSVLHVLFGMAAAYFTNYEYLLWVAFTIYQVGTFVEKKDHAFIDMSEFILGYAAIKLY